MSLQPMSFGLRRYRPFSNVIASRSPRLEDRSKSPERPMERQVRPLDAQVRPQQLGRLIFPDTAFAAVQQEGEDGLCLVRAGLVATPMGDCSPVTRNLHAPERSNVETSGVVGALGREGILDRLGRRHRGTLQPRALHLLGGERELDLP